VINEALARRYFGASSPIGQRVALGRRGGLEIVGVVANAKYLSLREKDHPTIYVHALQTPQLGGLTLTAKISVDPTPFAAALRREIRALGANGRVGTVETLSSQIDRSLVNERLVARLLGGFAGLAVLLAAIGLYGVLGYAVTRRTSEIGVRLALGATPGAILRSVLSVSWRLVAIGTIFGVPVALGLTRVLSSLLYGVTPTDPWILSGAVSCLFLVALIAAWLPARRASNVDPLVALRHE
jgi:predicted lysophospholipase L1 biosynthesis ABC-type transport system permease subunit